jgi:hypothetical protein
MAEEIIAEISVSGKKNYIMGGKAMKTKGSRKHPDYHSWMALRRRCRDINFIAYKDYGGRGITVCEHWWNSFANFTNDMGPKPPRHSIHRIDNDLGYWCGHCDECVSLNRPANCMWATKKIQDTVKRSSVYYQYKGEKLTRAQLAEVAGIEYIRIRDRVDRNGWDLEEALTTPDRVYEHLTALGKTMPIGQWCSETGLSYDTIRGRIKSGWNNDSIVTTPNGSRNPDKFRSRSVVLTIDGVSKILNDWARESSVDRKTIAARLARGMSHKDAVFSPKSC